MAPCHVYIYISLHVLSFVMSKEYIRDGYFLTILVHPKTPSTCPYLASEAIQHIFVYFWFRSVASQIHLTELS